MNTELLVAISCVIVAIIMTLTTLYFYFKDATLETLRVDAYKLFLKAENKYKESGKGKEKMQWVLSVICNLMPGWMKIFISDEMLESIVQMWFDNIKDLLDDGKINKSAEV